MTLGPIWSGASKPEGPTVFLRYVMGRKMLGPCGTALGPTRRAAPKLVGTRCDPLGTVGTRWDPWSVGSCVGEHIQVRSFGTAGTDDLYNTKFKVPSPISPTSQDHWPAWYRLPEVGLLSTLINFLAKAFFFMSPPLWRNKDGHVERRREVGEGKELRQRCQGVAKKNGTRVPKRMEGAPKLAPRALAVQSSV